MRPHTPIHSALRVCGVARGAARHVPWRPILQLRRAAPSWSPVSRPLASPGPSTTAT